MARGLRQLIDHLLNEISLCGAFGASPQDVCRYIKEFYDQASDRPLADASADHAIEGEGDLQPAAAPAQLVDRAFEETVWTWLTQQPEVSVGQNRQGNGLTLSEVEATHGPAAAQGDASARSPYLRQGPPLPVSTAGKRGAVKPSPPPPSSGPPDQASHGLQVYVSSSRMWLAVAGHERDDARVSPLEFTLLSIIAMHKGRGITQPELVRLSGQDKRSVPKRTDGLARAGYIEKKPVLSKSTRTSLCTLRKFVGTAAPASATATAAATAADVAADNDDGSFFDLESFFDRLIEVLQECQVITRADLRDSLGMTGMKRRKVLQRSLGKLVALGCIQKVKATSQYHDILHKKLSSIQLVRVPTAEDRRLFFELSPALVDTRGQGGAEGDGDGDADEEGEDFTTRWSPDRPLYNQLYELIAASGTEGLTNLQLVKSSLGLFYRRPIEAITSRLVESWPSAQPQHLRKFAIVRDLGIRGTISHYVHYTLDNLQQLIREGKASADILDQLIPPSSSKKSGGHAIPPLDAAAELDQYGFPLNETPPAGLVNGGDASLRDCLAAARPVPPNLPPRQPRIVRRRDGTRDVMIERRPNAPPMTRREDRDPERQRPLTKYQRLLKRHEDRPEKEQLEAIGMDMGWTEYAVHVIPRPTPGAYLTPFGKRRATGNARGRPRKSRILIIKTLMLRLGNRKMQ
ncbi:hypothetical protein KEM52_001491 [Ascosphaera acerosa]|nr:hypothetical protein KEM52_001491 [Ascosphaera acerosa]